MVAELMFCFTRRISYRISSSLLLLNANLIGVTFIISLVSLLLIWNSVAIFASCLKRHEYNYWQLMWQTSSFITAGGRLIICFLHKRLALSIKMQLHENLCNFRKYAFSILCMIDHLFDSCCVSMEDSLHWKHTILNVFNSS